ncbi:MAG: pilus assembly protein TadG-related protein [Anaerolineaceae bacterium]|nr:pilus assembly protein TadG-related protein [Anaerolineaceae bacterium]
MRNSIREDERGQVLILLVVGMVALLGFAALAIDGGMAFSERRNAQNAADAAAVAGAYAIAYDPGIGKTLAEIETDIVQAAAIPVATRNGYTNGGDTVVDVQYPPVTGDYAGNPLYVQTIITAKVNTALIHFVYDGEVKNTVTAVAHFTPATKAPLYGGNGLVSLAPHECPGLSTNGNFSAILTVGGIFVNSDCNPAVEGNSNTKTIDTPSISSVGSISYDFLHKGTIDVGSINQPAPQYPYPPGITMVNPPNCGAAEDAVYTDSTQTWAPPAGKTTAVIPGGLPHDFKGILAPGVYCIDSGGFTFNAQANWTGIGVTLFITGSHPCDFTWNGGAEIKLYAPNSTKYPTEAACTGDTCNFKGIVIYVDPKGFATWPDTKDTTIDGNNNSEIYGTLYAPTCHMKKTGVSGMQFVGQLIGYDFSNIGTANLILTFDADDAGEGITPAYIDLVR